MRVIIAGSRDFRNYDLLKQKCDEILFGKDEVEIVSGTARGADKMGEFYASERKYPVKLFPADWNQYGKSAGYIRNKQMAEYANILICFWDGQSKGTQHMINLAKDLGLEVHTIIF
jgi:hypothetical protein